ncbi:hypothetical protein [Hyphomonas adhaerens]|uniref:hypothetical protein n=1 Tax=Hyphomonas adhaerens TaxID=81029 RepID=UPI0023574D0B|nr:hypothetical protein [Hyphomonas adhaerens]
MFEHDPTDPHEVGLNADRLAAVPAFFEKNYLDTGKLPCMATLISRNGRSRWKTIPVRRIWAKATRSARTRSSASIP